MKKLYKFLFLTIIVFLPSLSIANITVIGGKGYAPYYFLGHNGKIRGILVDIWKVWERHTGIKVNFEIARWYDAQKKVKKGEADVIIGMFYSDERAKWFDFSMPFLTIDGCIFFHKSISGLKGPEDLAGFHVGVLQGDYAETFFKKNYPKVRLVLYPTYEDMVKHAIKGEIKVFVGDRPALLFYLAKFKQGVEFRYIKKPLYSLEVRAAVKKGNKKLLSLVNKGFEQIKGSEIKGILDKWSGVSILSRAYSFFYVILVVLVITCVATFLWIYSLRKLVARKTRELEEAYNILNSVINNTNIGFMVRDIKGRILKTNKIYLDIVGENDPQEIIGRHIREFIYDDIDVQQDVLKELKEKGHIKGIEYTYKRKDGVVFYLLLNAVFLKKQGKIVFLLHDITKRVEQEFTIQRLANRLDVTLESIGDGVISTDVHGRIEFFNSVAERLTGWTKKEAIGKKLEQVFNIISEKTRAPVVNPHKRVMDTGQIVGLGNHTLLVRKNGEHLPILDSGAPIKDKQGNIIGVVIVFRDGSSQKQREEELIKLEQLNSIVTFSAGIAHDFNNILGSILMNLSIINMDKSIPDNIKYKLKLLEDAVLRARDLVKQLVMIAKIKNPVKECFSCKDRLEKIASLVLAGSNIELDLDLDKGLWPVIGDRAQLDQVVQNIFINAKDAMPGGGKIKVIAQNTEIKVHEKLSPGRYVKIKICDQGEGIKKENLEKIFDPYFSTKKGGTGLGLFVVKSVLEKHDGHVEVESEVHKGTCFTLYLPAGERKLPDEHRDFKGTGKIKGKRILFMDDEEMFRSLMKEVLKELGADVVVVENGEQAVDEYIHSFKNGNKFHVVILDLTVVGGMGGDEAGKRIIGFDKSAKVLISSGHSIHPLIKQYKKAGFAGAIKKPYTIQELSSVIEGILS